MTHHARVYLRGVLVGEVAVEIPRGERPPADGDEVQVALVLDHARLGERAPLFLEGRLSSVASHAESQIPGVRRTLVRIRSTPRLPGVRPLPSRPTSSREAPEG